MPRRAKPWFRTADGFWYATHNGRQLSLGVRGRANEAAAWREWERLRNGEGAQPAPSQAVEPVAHPNPAQPAAVTVRAVFDAFLTDSADRVSPGTHGLYRMFLNGFADRYGALPAQSVTCPLAEAYSRRPNWADSTRAAFLGTLVRAFYHAERARLIERTPLLGLRKPPIGSRAADAMVSASDHRKLCAVAPPHFRVLLEMLYLTGCRPSEATQLTEVDIDWEAGTAVIRKHKTVRKGKRRVLYLTPAAVSLLRGLADQFPSGLLFRNAIGKPWTRSSIGMAMRKAARSAGLSRRIAYGYRHAFATDALAAGVPDAQVAELLGHTSTAMLHKHYSHLSTRVKVLTDAAKVVR